jgi:hypothetical protein
MKNAMKISVIASMTGALLTVSGCGGAQKEPVRTKLVPVQSDYEKRCEREAAKRRAAETHKRYLPPELLLHRWPGRKDSDPSPQVLSEEALVDLLVEGKPRSILLVARGGTGKSKLAWSVEAQTCGRVKTVLLDLNWELARHLEQQATNAASVMPGGKAKQGAAVNPVVAIAAAKLGATGDPAAYLSKSFAKSRWILLLDSLDEVPLGQRKKVMDHVNAAMKAHPTMHALMLTRPPVYSGNYGLTQVDAFAELPQLDCAHSDAAINKLVTDKVERDALLKFAKEFGLLRKATGPTNRCYYPHLSTYRDFNVVRQLAANHAAAAKSIDVNTLASSRAEIYKLFLSVQLVRDLQTVGGLPEAALATVDAMLLRHKPGAGDRNTRFTSTDCTQVKTGDDAKANDAYCDQLMKSSLFKVANGTKTFRLQNQSVYDLFMARWMAGLLRADKTKSCAAIAKHDALFESNEIGGFLAGLDAGQKCLVPLAQQLCKRGGFAEHNFEQLDQGLPHGSGRKKIIDAAQDAAEKASEGPGDVCVTALLDRLYKAVK